MNTSFCEPETARLRFDSDQDALDFASKCVKDSKRLLGVSAFDFGQRYQESEIELRIAVRSRTDGKQFHLVFCANR